MSTAEVSYQPSEGWHCNHLYYRWDRAVLANLTQAQKSAGADEFQKILAASSDSASTGTNIAPARIQVGITAGLKADFSLMLMDPDPLKIDSLKHALAASTFGPALMPTYSYVSLTEVSEYVPTVAQYGERLVEEGEQLDSPAYKAKLKAYESREAMMRKQRLTPDFPAWPNSCFYPMNKWRLPGANWFNLPHSERHRLMAEHGRTGMTFGGKVTQLITVGIGLDDWEWGVTLWARNPEFLKEIVYKMRFDEASAKYAEFGPFYTTYIMTAAEVLKHCRVN